MKYLLVLSACLFLAISCKPKDLPTEQSVSSQGAFIKMSHMTTQKEMERFASSVRLAWRTKFDFSESTFFEDGKLRTLKFQIVTPNGLAASGSADLQTLQHKYFQIIGQKENDELVIKKVGNSE